MMETETLKSNRKNLRKQKRAQHRLERDMNIPCSDEPTQYVMVCNAGLVTGLQRETLASIVEPVERNHDLILPPGKSYSFIKFPSIHSAEVFYKKIHGRYKLEGQSSPLYLTFTVSVPNLNSELWNSNLPSGLSIIENVITEDEEDALLKSIVWEEEDSASSELKHRKVKHFGYEFRYDTNTVNPNEPIIAIPESYGFLQTLFEKHDCGNYKYDQLTINRYLPGQGIPPHIDTHSVFEDTILSLSLGSDCVMDFKRENKKIPLFLPARSLLIMSKEARYAWSHGICPRHNDVIQMGNGVTTKPRGTRTSFTFRKVRTGDCRCNHPEFCDSKRTDNNIDEKSASELEQSYVHKVYDEISSHFNETRHKQWPNVAKFLDSIEIGGLLLDVGCGNGKYLVDANHVFKMGCDRSSGLAEICRKRNFEVLLADCLAIPYKSNSLDAAISIAVIHHLSTHERRKQAVSEIVRVLKPGGKCLIYVWAKEQNKDSVESAYLKHNTERNKPKKKDESENYKKIDDIGVILPVHENRTEFTHSDMLVPWKRKGGGNFLRYYHVFVEGELEKLCFEVSGVNVEKVYYDQGNWCVILQKKNKNDS